MLHPGPGSTSPLIRLPPSRSRSGDISVRSARVFASGFLQAGIAALPLPSATLRPYLAGSGL